MTKLSPSRNDPVLARYAKQIRAIAKRTVSDIIKIGAILSKAKKRARGGYLLWLDRELGWSPDWAENLVNVFEFSRTARFRKFRNLPASALYLLAKKSTPEEVRAAVATRIKTGGRITLSEVRNTVRRIGPRYTPPEPQSERLSIVSAEHNAPPPPLKPLTAEDLHAASRRSLIGLIVEVASQLPHDQSVEEASAVVESVGDAEGMRERFREAVAKLYGFVGQLQRALNEEQIDEEPARPPLRIISEKDN
jgi:hypothetical protein